MVHWRPASALHRGSPGMIALFKSSWWPARTPPVALTRAPIVRTMPAPFPNSSVFPWTRSNRFSRRRRPCVGGRNGHSEASDGAVSVNLSVPKAMGGPGKPDTTTPEHLFATGYAACFGGALDFVAKQKKSDATKAKITCAVSIGPRDGGGFGIAVKMHVEDKTLPQATLAALVKEAHENICPY